MSYTGRPKKVPFIYKAEVSITIPFVKKNWIKLTTNPSWLDNLFGRAAVSIPEDESSNTESVDKMIK